MTTQLPEPESFAFGDSAEMADDLLALVLQGTKTATCGALDQYKREGAPLPQVGQRIIVLNGRGEPACIIEILEVSYRTFDSIELSFARAEGEGDLSLLHWQQAHRAYFERNGGFSPDMILVCEKFRLIERIAGLETMHR